VVRVDVSYSTGKDRFHRARLKTIVITPLCSESLQWLSLRKPAPAIEPNGIRRDPRRTGTPCDAVAETNEAEPNEIGDRHYSCGCGPEFVTITKLVR